MPDFPSSARTQELIHQCKQIAAIFDECMPDTAIDPHAHRIGGVNPYYNRTAAGLYLEFYYGYPSKIWTPGGQWTMTGSTITHGDRGDTAEALVAPFMARLTTRLHEPMRQSRWGCYGPVYAVLAIDGTPVEEPGDVIPFSKDGYSEMKTEWAELACWKVADA